MTYCEIYNEVYGNDKTLEDLCVTPMHAAAWMVLVRLNNLKGFDAWWESIDDSTKDEIFLRLVHTIENTVLGIRCPPKS